MFWDIERYKGLEEVFAAYLARDHKVCRLLGISGSGFSQGQCTNGVGRTVSTLVSPESDTPETPISLN